MNIYTSHPTSIEQTQSEPNSHFEPPALALSRSLTRFISANIKLVGLEVFFGIFGLMFLLKLVLEIYRLLIEPFSFPNLDF